MFTQSKVAQIAAVFARHEGGAINILKLMKLMYLVDREAMAQDGDPITFDRMVSMDHGPVLSQSYDLAKGGVEHSEAWDRWLSDRAHHNIALKKKKFSRNDLDQLSSADLRVIESVWQRFGHMNQWQLRDYMHENCPEWKDPEGSSIPINESAIYSAFGKDEEEIKEYTDRIALERKLDRVLSDR